MNEHGDKRTFLINRTPPEPQDSLASMLGRLGADNHYERENWYVDLLPTRPRASDINVLREAAIYERLSYLTFWDVDALYNHTLHSLIPCYLRPEDIARLPHATGDIPKPLWDSGGLWQYVCGQRAVKVCPLCWLQRQVAPLTWLLRAVTTCPLHQVLLVDRCVCGYKLRINYLTGRCALCKARPSDIPVVSVAEHQESLWLANLVKSATRPECSDLVAPNRGHALQGSDHPLARMNNPSLHEFFFKFAPLVATRDPANPLLFADRLVPGTGWLNQEAGRGAGGSKNQGGGPPSRPWLAGVPQLHAVLVAVSELLRGWPDSWQEMLRRVAEHEFSVENMNNRHRFPVTIRRSFVGAHWDWMHNSIQDFIETESINSGSVYYWLRFHRAMPVVVGTDAATTRKRYRLLSMKEAARHLGIGERAVKAAITMGRLDSTAEPPPGAGGARRWRLIPMNDVTDLKAKYGALRTLAEAATFCGLTEEHVVALAVAGLILAERGPIADGSAVWGFTAKALNDFVSKTLEAIPLLHDIELNDDTSCEVLPLTKAVRIASWEGVTVPQLLAAFKENNLRTYRRAGDEASGIRTVCYLRGDLLGYLAWRRNTQADGRVLLSAHDVCRQLRCKPSTLQRLYASGLLVPWQDDVDKEASGRVRWRYDATAVAAFQERYISTEEAARILAVGMNTVTTWAAKGKIPVVSGPVIDGAGVYRYDRAELIRWRAERLTFGEAMRMLGVSKATLHRWVEEGKLTPLRDMGKQRWFDRADVLRLCKVARRGVSEGIRTNSKLQ